MADNLTNHQQNWLLTQYWKTENAEKLTEMGQSIWYTSTK
jgi:hypothetical protein